MCNDIIIMSLLKDIDSTLHVTIGLIPRPLSLGGRGLGTKLCGSRLCSSLVPSLSCMGLGMRLRLKLVCGSYPALFPVPPFAVHCTYNCPDSVQQEAWEVAWAVFSPDSTLSWEACASWARD